MSDINHAVVQGRLTKDPQWFPKNEDGTPHDHDRAWAVLAVNPPTKHPNAKPSFIVINAFGNRARVLAKFGKKGKVWGVVGSIKTDRKELPDGTFKNFSEISVAQNIMGPDSEKGKQEAAAAEASAQSEPEPQSDALAEASKALVDLGVSTDDLAALLAKKKKEQSADAPF